MATKLKNGALVVVATGAEAKLFRRRGDGRPYELEFETRLEPVNLDSEGPAGSRPQVSTQKETDEATFAKQLAEHLYEIAHAGKADQIALLVDPDTLGEMRPSLHVAVEKRIALTIPITLVNNPTDDIKAALDAAEDGA